MTQLPTTLDIERALKTIWRGGYELTVCPRGTMVFVRVKLPWWTWGALGLAQALVKSHLQDAFTDQPVSVEVF